MNVSKQPKVIAWSCLNGTYNGIWDNGTNYGSNTPYVVKNVGSTSFTISDVFNGAGTYTVFVVY